MGSSERPAAAAHQPWQAAAHFGGAPSPSTAVRDALEGPDPAFPIPLGAVGVELAALPECLPRAVEPSALEVTEVEFAWMVERRPLVADEASLTVDYGAAEAREMLVAFETSGQSHLVGALAWPGVGTRWQAFLTFCTGSGPFSSPDAAFRAFGTHLGRVTTYRALALDSDALQRIFAADSIFPSGQLRVGRDVLEAVVAEKGVRAVCVARLFIAYLREILGHDPSISLHDDWQTTSVIASGYACWDRLDPQRSKPVYLFELSVPVVESIGWTLTQVEGRSEAVLGQRMGGHEWFCFPSPCVPQGTWFKGSLQRTERYGLYGVPHLAARLSRCVVFQSKAALRSAVMPFVQHQERVHNDEAGGET